MTAQVRLLEIPPAGLDFRALERDLVIQAVERARGNLSAAGRLLTMTRYQMRYRLEKHALWPFLEAVKKQPATRSPQPA